MLCYKLYVKNMCHRLKFYAIVAYTLWLSTLPHATRDYVIELRLAEQLCENRHTPNRRGELNNQLYDNNHIRTPITMWHHGNGAKSKHNRRVMAITMSPLVHNHLPRSLKSGLYLLHSSSGDIPWWFISLSIGIMLKPYTYATPSNLWFEQYHILYMFNGCVNSNHLINIISIWL